MAESERCLWCVLSGYAEDLPECQKKTDHHPFPKRFFGNGKDNYFKVALGEQHHQKMERLLASAEKNSRRKLDYKFYYDFLIKFFNEEALVSGEELFKENIVIYFGINVKKKKGESIGQAAVRLMIGQVNENRYRYRDEKFDLKDFENHMRKLYEDKQQSRDQKQKNLLLKVNSNKEKHRRFARARF